MSVHVKYFANLRERLGRNHDEVKLEGEMTVLDVWNVATQSLPTTDSLLVAVNQEYAHFDHAVHDGDEVAFFPPVTGG